MNSLTTIKFNRWTLIKRVEKTRPALWLCKCDCGNEKTVIKGNVVRGLSKSCGCLNNETRGKSSITHHEAGPKVRTKEYRIWTGMKVRCQNKNCKAFKDYGGRGIKVCERWLSYENFLVDMGRCPLKMTLDRIDNNKGYEPSNCRWADRITQANNARTNRLVYYNGERKTFAMWCRTLGLRRELTAQRIDRDGWSIERAFSDRNDRQQQALQS